MRFVKRHIKAFVIGTLVAVFTSGGVALAAWLVTGTGSAKGGVATLSAPSMSNVAPTTSDLLPGGSGTLYASVTNPNSVALKITAINNAGATATSSDPTNCGSGLFTVNNLPMLNITIPTGVSTISIPGGVSLSSSAPTTCQGVTVTINYAANAITYST